MVVLRKPDDGINKTRTGAFSLGRSPDFSLSAAAWHATFDVMAALLYCNLLYYPRTIPPLLSLSTQPSHHHFTFNHSHNLHDASIRCWRDHIVYILYILYQNFSPTIIVQDRYWFDIPALPVPIVLLRSLRQSRLGTRRYTSTNGFRNSMTCFVTRPPSYNPPIQGWAN